MATNPRENSGPRLAIQAPHTPPVFRADMNGEDCMNSLHALTALALLTGLSACGGEEDELGAGDYDLVIKPKGTSNAASLIVHAPEGATNLAKTTVSYGGKKVELGEPLGPLPLGKQKFTLETPDYGLKTEFFVTIYEFNSGETINIFLGGIALIGAPAEGEPETLGIGDAKFYLPGVKDPVSGSLGWKDPSTQMELADGSVMLPMLGGKYQIRFGLEDEDAPVDGRTFSLQSGDTKVINLNDLADRKMARITVGGATLPDARCEYGVPDGWYLAASPNANSSHQGSNAGPFDIGVLIDPYTYDQTLVHYHVTTNVWAEGKRAYIPLGKQGKGPLEWELGRLDVEDVLINDTDLVKGHYAVYPVSPTGTVYGENFLKCKPETNTGVYLPPGKYSLVVEYMTEEGFKKDSYPFELP